MPTNFVRRIGEAISGRVKERWEAGRQDNADRRTAQRARASSSLVARGVRAIRRRGLQPKQSTDPNGGPDMSKVAQSGPRRRGGHGGHGRMA